MKKNLFYKFACFKGLTNEKEYPEAPEYVPDDSQIMNVLNEIFAVDPATGLPRGDIAYYLSPNGNPTVKEWLMNNLMRPKFGVQARNNNLTDDMIAEFSRGFDESVDAYASRMAGYRDSAIEEYNKSLQENKLD